MKVTSAGRATQHFRALGDFSVCHFVCTAKEEVGLKVSLVTFLASCGISADLYFLYHDGL